MNDPNGPIYWKGQYHVFYQYNPNAARWGDTHWAHSVSKDMIHWRHLPIALSPNPIGPDRDGCFSGSTVVRNGVPTILYTGVRSTSPNDATLRDGTHDFHESQCIATSFDSDLRSWTTSPIPVIADLPNGLAKDWCRFAVTSQRHIAIRNPIFNRERRGNVVENRYIPFIFIARESLEAKSTYWSGATFGA
jgi:sucrose-6-phosphate hydrolase SacC (GH32 family)